MTPVPGTTRDILELSLDVGGLPVIVADTAGIRDSHDLVEGIGIERAKNVCVCFPSQSWLYNGLRYPCTDSVQAADVSLCVLSLPDVIKHDGSGSEVEIPSILRPFISSRTLFLLNKSDLVHSPPSLNTAGHRSWIASLWTGEGTAEFMAGFAKALHEQLRRSLLLLPRGHR